MRRRSAIYEMMDRRNETYLLGSLSIIGGEYAYSVPRRKLGDIERYSKVEVGLMGPRGLCRPSSIGLPAYLDALFEDNDGPVAPYLSWEQVEQLRKALRGPGTKPA